MLNPKIAEAFNKQINAELYSAYLYVSMSAYFEARSLEGMANWMRIQAQEEVGHAMKFFNFLNDRDGRVILAAIDQPKTEWDSPAEAFQDAYQHEQKVTGLINGLSALATAEKDYASHNFLEWFVAEQVEEENAVRTILDQFKLAGSDGVGQLILDERLGKRPAAASAAPQAGTP
ncbi:MAG TPA: ferritin [Thermoguttaceae bacterium]|nr:ferritin [Thermoguttaceae bacterium]